MTFDWNNFISLAEYLKANCDDLNTGECIDREATYRTIVNRAYYAAYNVANQFALKEFGKIVKGDNGDGSHSKLIKTFRYHEQENDNFANIAVKLGRIKNCRVDADYKHKFRDGHPNFTAQMTMRFSQDIISIIDSIEKTAT